MKAIGIFGTSGFAREVNDIADDLGFRAVYIARDKAELVASASLGDVALESDVGRYNDMQFTIGIGENTARQKVSLRFADTLRFINLVHPSASFGKGQRDSIDSTTGVIVCAGVRFTNNIRIGNFTIFNLNVTIGHDVIIDDFVNVSPGACISGNVRIGTRCWIGTGAVVNQGTGYARLVIGDDTVIGSGSVVVKDCESNSVYVGVPVKKIK